MSFVHVPLNISYKSSLEKLISSQLCDPTSFTIDGDNMPVNPAMPGLDTNCSSDYIGIPGLWVEYEELILGWV